MEQTRLWGAHRFVIRFVNPVISKIAGWALGFGLVTHRGWTTGRRHLTPVNVVRDRDGFRFVLTYGSSASWVRNVLAAGDCRLRTRHRTLRLVNPEVVRDPALPSFPTFVRLVGRVVGVTELVTMRIARPNPAGSTATPAHPPTS